MLRLVYSNGEGFATATNTNLTPLYPPARIFNSVREYSIDDDFPGLSTVTSNSNKTFDTTQRIRFTGVFDMSKGMTIFFKNDNCKRIRIRLYTSATSTTYADVELTVNGNRLYYAAGNYEPHNIEIIFLETKGTGQQITVTDITLGNITYTEFTEFQNIELLEEYNILSTDLPMNELDFTVTSENELEIGKKVSLYSNDIYFGTFYIDSVQPVASGAYECVAYNSIRILDKNDFEESTTTIFEPGQTLYGFLTTVNANTSAIIDEKTKTTITEPAKIGMRGFIPIESYRKALCRMCWAMGYSIDSARSDIIYLKKIPTQVTKNITDNRIIGQSVFKKGLIYKRAKYRYVTSFSARGALNTIKITPGNGIKRYFSEPPGVPYEESFYVLTELKANYFKYTMSGSTDQSISVYKQRFDNQYEEIINPDAAEDGKEMQFTDFECVGLSNMSFVGYISQMSAYSYIEGTPIYRTNDILKYIKSKGTVQARVILDNNPIKPGDLVTINTAWQGTVKGIITKMTTHFGYQDVADVEIFNYE